MKVLFLCGGVGKRMFPFVEDKFLLKFLGKPLLQHQMEWAMGAGLNQFLMVANPQNLKEVEKISRNIPGARVEFAVQEKPLGIANALESAEKLLEDEMMVVNPNDIFESSAYTKLIKEWKKNSAISYLIGYKVKDATPVGWASSCLSPGAQ